MISIRVRLLVGLFALVTAMSIFAGLLTYRRVLNETSTLFDYQLREMALSLRNQASIAPRIELPPDQGDTDFVVQIWNPLGALVYLSRPGLPLIDRAQLGYADLLLQNQRWRVFSLQTLDGVIQIAQPWGVREHLAGVAAVRVVAPLLLLFPLMAIAASLIVGRGLAPLRRAAAEVQRRDARSLAPIDIPRPPAEVAPLIDALNRLLLRLSRTIEVQRSFVADAAHELRSPLTALSLQLQLLDRAPDEEARKDARTKLGAAVERSIHLVAQLLTLARNEPERMQADLCPVDLDAVAREAISDTNSYALTRGTALTLVSPEGVKLVADKEALRVLIRNLVDNAVRYSPPKSQVSVTIRALPKSVDLEVLDSGPGLEAQERGRAFDRFYRRSGSPEGGSGLGLAIAKAIADRHGAAIRLDNAPGGGLCATVSFPQAQ